MGMFDTVHYHCPWCTRITGVQTKSGECSLTNYQASKHGTNLPASLMTALAEEHEDEHTYLNDRIPGVSYPGPVPCEHCGKKFKLVLVHKPAARLEKVIDEEEW